MASLRAVNPFLRQAPRLAFRNSSKIAVVGSRRAFNSATAPVLATSHATVTGARTGHIEGDNLRLDLTMPTSLGGAGDKGKTNPEELFAAGYGACFQSAMNAVAPSLGLKMPSKVEDSVIETDVHLVGDMKKLDIGIRVDMRVKVKGLSKGDVEKLVEKTKEVCPYSRATKGNVQTNVEVLDA